MSWITGGEARKRSIERKRAADKVRERESNRINALLWKDRRNFLKGSAESKPVETLSDLLAKNKKK